MHSETRCFRGSVRGHSDLTAQRGRISFTTRMNYSVLDGGSVWCGALRNRARRKTCLNDASVKAEATGEIRARTSVSRTKVFLKT